jgi:hypothetical protein
MGQRNFTVFNKRKKVLVAGMLEKKHRSIIWGQNCPKLLRDGLLHREMAVADLLETFETRLHLENFNNVDRIWEQWVGMLLKKFAREVREAKKEARKGKKRPATDLGECAGNAARGNIPKLPNTTFMVVIG